jgi:hypothetical protein
MSTRKNPNRCIERRIAFYPHYKYHHLLIAAAHSLLIGKSKMLCDIVKEHFDRLPECDREKLMYIYDNMTDQERQYPGQL